MPEAPAKPTNWWQIAWYATAFAVYLIWHYFIRETAPRCIDRTWCKTGEACLYELRSDTSGACHLLK